MRFKIHVFQVPLPYLLFGKKSIDDDDSCEMRVDDERMRKRGVDCFSEMNDLCISVVDLYHSV